MAEKRQRKKRAPSFSSDELEILLDEVFTHKATLFASFRNNVCNTTKKELWSEIARKMAASGSGAPRDWQDVRKKWHDFSSIAKVRAAAVRRDRARTGAGSSSVSPLTPLEEKALAVLGESASHGIPGGIDVRRGDAEHASCSQARPSPPPSTPCSPVTQKPAAPSSPGSSEPEECTTPPPPERVSLPGRRRYSTARKLSPCRCSEELVNLERERLVVLHNIEQKLGNIERRLTEGNDLARHSLELKRAKLELAKQQHALAEAQFNRPSISVPILLPSEDAEQQSHQ